MIRAVMTRGKVGHIDVQLAVLDGFFASGLSVTADVLATSNVIGAALAPGRHPLFRWSIRTVHGGPVRSSSGVEIRADAALDPAAGEIVIAFGPGMADAERVLADVLRPDARALTSVLRGAHQRGAQVAASCSSTFLLAEAGLLDGGEATTSWWLAPLFRSRYPAIRLRADEIVCASGTVLTAAAAMAQLDLSLVLVRRLVGHEVAHACARYLVIDEARNSQAPFLDPSDQPRGDIGDDQIALRLVQQVMVVVVIDLELLIGDASATSPRCSARSTATRSSSGRRRRGSRSASRSCVLRTSRGAREVPGLAVVTAPRRPRAGGGRG